MEPVAPPRWWLLWQQPQPGWWPGEDLQRRRRRLGGATLRARQQNAALSVARLVQATSMACGVRLDCDVLLPCGHHEKIVNRLLAYSQRPDAPRASFFDSVLR